MKLPIKMTSNKLLTVILTAIIVTMVLLSPSKFLRWTTLQSMAYQLPELGLLSLAMMITMLTGGINLSIITGANLAGIITGLVLLSTGEAGAAPGWGVVLAIFAGLGVSMLLGALNGFLVAFIEIPAMLATLGTMTLVKGISILITRGSALSGLNSISWIGNAALVGIPVPLLIFIAGALLMALVLNRTTVGFSLYMIGSNPEATLFSGINTRMVLLKSYILSNLVAGVAALVMVSRFNSAKADYGESYLLVTVLAAVLGGTSAEGGFGKVSGLVLALVILQIISSGFNLMRVNPFLTVAFWGIIILLVMSVKHVARTRMAVR